MDDFEKESLRRLPLADASYRLLEPVIAPEFLQDVFARHRGNCYDKVITFPLMVRLVADALLEHGGSGRKSFTQAQAGGSLEASLKATYGKLARMPLALTRAFFGEATQRLRTVFPTITSTPLPESVRAFVVLTLDGKKIKHVARRLKILRGVKGKVLAAKVVVAVNLATGLAVGLDADPDGEVSDAPLVPGTLAQVRAHDAGPRLGVADRQFCDLVQPQLLSVGEDHFLIRYNAKVSFQRDPCAEVRTGVDGKGRTYQEEWGWLGSAKDQRRRRVRRITLLRPDEESVILVTDLLDAAVWPADDLLRVYLQRWGIERVFQRITEIFHLRRLIGGTPQAGVFQGAFCLPLYNVVVTLRALVSEARDEEPETISTENLFYDVHRQLVALHETVPIDKIAPLFGERLGGRNCAAICAAC
jgi:Transposase DDE domain